MFSGVSATGLLVVAFIVLKLAGIITWSWLWVLSPLWITGLLWAVIAMLWFVYQLLRKQ